MRASRKVNREHIRSPSPDIANKSIIKQTTPPNMYEILSKSRNKISQISTFNMPNNIEDMQTVLISLQQKYRELQKQLAETLFQNSGLKKQIIQLNNLSPKKANFAYNFASQPSQSNLRKYESIISNMSIQIKRIQQLLSKQKQKNNNLQNEINNLKNKQPLYSASQSKYQQSSYQIHYNALGSIEQNLLESFQKYRNQHDLKIHLSLNSLNQKLFNVEKNQTALQSRIASNDYRTPKTIKQSEKYQFSTRGYNSPGSGESKKIFEPQRNQNEQRQKDLNMLRNYQFEIQNLKKQIITLNYQLQRQKERTLKFQCPKCKIYITRIEELQKQIENLKLLRNKSKIYIEKIQCLQRENDELRSLKQQKKFYINRIQDLQNQNRKLKQLRQQEEYQKEFKNQLERQRSQSNIIQNLQDYLRKIKDVKSILGNQEFKQFLEKVDFLVIENTNLQSKLEQLLNQKQRLNRQNKTQVQLKKQVNQLIRQNKQLKIQVKDLQNQFKKLMEQTEEYMRTHTQNKPSHYTSHIQHMQSDTSKFKNYIGQAIKRLQSVQQSITKTITRN